VKSILALVLFPLGLLLVGCAQKEVESNLTKKMSVEQPVTGTAELQSDAGSLIDSSNLRAQQKNQLRALQTETVKKLQALRDESLKLRSILIKDVFSAKYNKSEVRLIQKKIDKLEHKRLALTFETIDKANGILGRETDAEESERLVNRMMRYPDMQ
jgi:hypothetical protein